MKKYLFTGFITLLPLALTIIIICWLFNFLTTPLAGLTESLILSFESSENLSFEHHAALVTFLSRLLALVLLFILILVLGVCGQRFLIRMLLKIPERLFVRIPLVRTIFRLSNELTKAVFSEDKKTFQQTVLVPFPHNDSLAVGFITGATPTLFKPHAPGADLAVFVPTAPHPISGFILLVPDSAAKKVDVSVEDAFKFLISCGTLHPGEPPPSSNVSS